MDSLCVLVTFFVFWEFFLPSSNLFLTLVSLAYVSLSSASKRYRGFESSIFCDSAMNLAAGEYYSSIVFVLGSQLQLELNESFKVYFAFHVTLLS